MTKGSRFTDKFIANLKPVSFEFDSLTIEMDDPDEIAKALDDGGSLQ